MANTQSEEDGNSEATLAGCLVMVLSLAVIVGVALPVVRWRDPASGQPLPRMFSIAVPVLAGAVCCGIATGILKIFGVPVSRKTKRESADNDAPARDEQNLS